MNLLFKLVLTVFKHRYEQISIISNNTSYSYKDILIKVYYLIKYLKMIRPTQIRVGLVASNSVEWIVVFLATIMSGNRLILFSPLLSKNKLNHVILDAKVKILFIDSQLITEVLNTTSIIIPIDKLDFTTECKESSHSFIEIESDLLKEFQSRSNFTEPEIVVYTPRSTCPIDISHNVILKVLGSIGKTKIFDNSSLYIAYPEFTFNYIIGLLLPFIEGMKIMIPGEKFTTYDAKWIFNTYKSEVVILNAYQFEEIWREFIESSTDELIKFLTEYRMNWIRKWILKRNMKTIFPNMKKLIILNSSISTTMETTLKSMKIPYTITYGSVESCGIATYSDPKDFKIGTVGKIVNNIVTYTDNLGITVYHGNTYIKSDDVLITDKECNIIFLNRTDETIQTEFGFIITRDVEKILKGLPLVTDCVLTKYNNSIILLVNIDTQYVDTYNIHLTEVKKKLELCRIEINNKVHSFEKIARIIIELSEFKRDSNGRILREYYTLD